MFDDEDLSAAVLADMRNICLLLTRSFVKVVLPSNASDEQKQMYREAVNNTHRQLDLFILQPIKKLHPGLSHEVLTIDTYLEEC